MPTVKILTDSACDIDPALLHELDVRMVPLTLLFGDESYLDGLEMRGEAFWNKLRACPDTPHTSQPSPELFRRTLDEMTADCSPVVAILLSGALSGTYQSAVSAARNLPDRKIAVINSKNASVGYGLLVMEASRKARSGASFDEVTSQVEAMVDRLVTVFSVDTLDYLHRNGRIGRAQHFWGSLLQVKPLLKMDSEGFVSGVNQVRCRARVIPGLLDIAASRVPYGCCVSMGVSHGHVPAEAKRLIAAAREKWCVERVLETEIGGVIGIHSGPGTLALTLLPTG